MTERENNVKQEQLNVRIAESKLAEAENAMLHGTEKAQSEYKAAAEKLYRETERAKIDVEKAKGWLAKAEADLEKPFTNSN